MNTRKAFRAMLACASLIPLLSFCQQSADRNSEAAALLGLIQPGANGTQNTAANADDFHATGIDTRIDAGISSQLILRQVCGVQAYDAQEGGSVDLKQACISYSPSQITMDLYFFAPVTAGWGNPYVYFYDSHDAMARDMLIFDSAQAFHIQRDRDGNGAFETLVFSGSSVAVLDGGHHYTVTLPRGVMPDISSRRIWAYAMSSRDRLPDSGALEFTANVSTAVTDPSEGGADDYSRLKVGYDAGISYIELELYNPVNQLAWGAPYVYLYDPAAGSSGRYLVLWTGTEVQLRQDADGDGAFEALLYSGNSLTRLENGQRFTMILPGGLISDMASKTIWSYSMQSHDRVPDAGVLTFP